MSEVKILGKAFAAVLKEWLTDEQFQEMKDWNGQNRDNPCCASHDYCDANIAMHEAFLKTGIAKTEDEIFNNITLWNGAWAHARQEGLI